MEAVFLGEIRADTYTFDKVRPSAGWPGLDEGRSVSFSDTFCRRLLSGAPASTADAAADPAYADAPIRAKLGITSYVGVPVRNHNGEVVATLCGIDRDSVPVGEGAVAVLRELADVVAAHLRPAADGVVIRRIPEGGWAVGHDSASDLTSAMVLADLLAAELSFGSRPSRSDAPLDEVGQLRRSVKQLEHALAARVVVEQAIGVLAERQRSVPRDAFERLRKVARSRGRRVHDLAREVVRSAHDPAVPLPPELAGRR